MNTIARVFGLNLVRNPIPRSSAAIILMMLAVAACASTTWPEAGLARALIEDGGLLLIVLALRGQALSSAQVDAGTTGGRLGSGPRSTPRLPNPLFTLLGAFGMGAQSGSLMLGGLFLLAALGTSLPLIRRGISDPGYRARRCLAALRGPRSRVSDPIACGRSLETITISPALLYRSIAAGMPVLLAWPLFEAIGVLQHVDILPVLLRWP